MTRLNLVKRSVGQGEQRGKRAETSRKRNLVFMGFDSVAYVEPGKMLLRSLDAFLTRTDTDVMVMVPEGDVYERMSRFVDDTKHERKNGSVRYIFHVPRDKDGLFYRVDVASHMQDYEKVLYIDTDVLVVSPTINDVFDEVLEQEKLYVHAEGHYKSSYHGMGNYSAEQTAELMSRGILPFNAGQYLFLYSEAMAAHFAKVREMMLANSRYFVDQKCLNHYFNTKYLSEIGRMEKYVTLFAKPTTAVKGSTCLLHFCGGAYNGVQKEKSMAEFMKRNEGLFRRT